MTLDGEDFNMKRQYLLGILMALAMSLACAQKRPVAPTDYELDLLLQRLESTGRMDQAFDRAFERFLKRAEAAEQLKTQRVKEQQEALNRNVAKPNPKFDHVFGNLEAPVTLIMFSDYECPYCKRFHKTPQEVVMRSEGRVNLVWRHFPLGIHNPMAQREAEAAECVAQQQGSEGFWHFSDLLMERTGSNGQGVPDQLGKDGLEVLFTEMNLDLGAIAQCQLSQAVRERIGADMANGQQSGINGTPGLIIYENKSGKVRGLNGAVPISTLEAEIKALLAPAHKAD